jgi:hypothetical protein
MVFTESLATAFNFFNTLIKAIFDPLFAYLYEFREMNIAVYKDIKWLIEQEFIDRSKKRDQRRHDLQ